MGKRSNFDRLDKDAYMTIDPRAAEPLIRYLGSENLTYYEPCVGDGSLKKLLSFECVGDSDMEKDARSTQYRTKAQYFITNPPWSRELLHPIIENLRSQLPTWLLFDADWMHTRQSSPYMKYCSIILSVGRLIWMPGTTMTGKDNCAWYLFGPRKSKTVFIGRE